MSTHSDTKDCCFYSCRPLMKELEADSVASFRLTACREKIKGQASEGKKGTRAN